MRRDRAIVRRVLVLVMVWSALVATRGWAQTSACDLVQPYGTPDSADVQASINMALGLAPCTANIAGAGVCNVVVVQRVVNASLPGGSCRVDGAIAHSATLTWTASVSSGIAGYNVYRGSTSGGGYTKINTSLVVMTSYIDNNVQAGQTYYYVATAVDTSGRESVYSNESRAVIPSP